MAESWTALYLAYSLVWVGVMVYITYIYMRQRAMKRDIDSLLDLVKKNEK